MHSTLRSLGKPCLSQMPINTLRECDGAVSQNPRKSACFDIRIETLIHFPFFDIPQLHHNTISSMIEYRKILTLMDGKTRIPGLQIIQAVIHKVLQDKLSGLRVPDDSSVNPPRTG